MSLLHGLRWHARRRSLVAFWLLVGVLVLAGCGSRGYAPPLSGTGHATLTTPGGQRLGAATLTPFYALHVVTYYPSSSAIPYADAKTPVQLRSDACNGPVLAALTQNAPGPDATSATSQAGMPTTTATGAAEAATGPVVVRSDSAGGVDVSLSQTENSYVVVLDQPNDPAERELACGHPLSDRRQFFDLYPPVIGSNSTGKGFALMEPISATNVQIQLASAPAQPLAWEIHSSGCDGAVLGSGAVASGATTGSGVVFAALDTSHWWLTTAATASAPQTCAHIGA